MTSDDVIKTIIKRIKTQVPDDEQVSQRGLARKQHARSESTTDAQLVASSSVAHIVSPPPRAQSVHGSSSEGAAVVGGEAITRCKLCEEVVGSELHACSYLGRQHMCDECGRAFTSADSLASHLQWHDNVRSKNFLTPAAALEREDDVSAAAALKERESSPDVQIINDPNVPEASVTDPSEMCRCLLCDQLCDDRAEKIKHLLIHFKALDDDKLQCEVCATAIRHAHTRMLVVVLPAAQMC